MNAQCRLLQLEWSTQHNGIGKSRGLSCKSEKYYRNQQEMNAFKQAYIRIHVHTFPVRLPAHIPVIPLSIFMTSESSVSFALCNIDTSDPSSLMILLMTMMTMSSSIIGFCLVLMNLRQPRQARPLTWIVTPSWHQVWPGQDGVNGPVWSPAFWGGLYSGWWSRNAQHRSRRLSSWV